MTQLQGFGALLFGAVALAFVGTLAILFGGPLEITLALAAMFAAYGSQFFSFAQAATTEYGLPRGPDYEWWAKFASWGLWASIALGAASFLLSVWF